MDSRQRVLTALNHQEADRVPIDLDGMRSTGIMAIAYIQLKAHLGYQGSPTRVYDMMQQLAMPEPFILERFGVDVLPLNRLPRGLNPRTPRWRSWRLPDGSPAVIPSELNLRPGPDGDQFVLDDDGIPVQRMPAGAVYFEPIYHALANAQSVAEVEAYRMPLIKDSELEWLRRQAKRLRSSGKAIMGQSGASVYEPAQNLRGWEQFMRDLAENPAMAEAVMNKTASAAIENLTRYLAAVGEYIDIIQVGDDLGTQHGPQLSPRMYRQLVKPYQRQVYQHAHRLSSKPVFLHSCGGIYPLIPDLIDAGVNILNPVQVSATGMDPARLKREFGKDLVFWGGGAETQHILPNGSPAEVRRNVQELVEIFAPGGGFVFCQVHNIQAGVPPANIVAMYETALHAGRYRA